MNYDLLATKMETFFAETSAEILISKFEELGYVFTDNINYISDKTCTFNIRSVSYSSEINRWFFQKKIKQNLINKSDLENFEVFFCNIASWL